MLKFTGKYVIRVGTANGLFEKTRTNVSIYVTN